jgi:hypothetical protein
VARLDRLRGRGWALVPLGSIVVVVFSIRFLSDTAVGLTYLALIAVPPLAAAAVAWSARGPGPVDRGRVVWSVGATAVLFAIAWIFHRSLAGEVAAAVLSALSCVTLAVLLAAVTPAGWLKLGIVAMAAADTWLVVSDLLKAPNSTLIAAHPVGGLPRLQSVIFGSASMGYGDLFVAALFGAVLAAERRRLGRAALLTLAIAAVFDLLFLAVNEQPGTVPVALAHALVEGRRALSAERRPSLQADAIPRQVR